MKTDSICDLLKVVFVNTYFRFQDTIFKQTLGLPMGNSVSGLMAAVYMDAFEERTLNSLNVALYRRYVDDVFCLTTCEEEAKTIFQAMNSQDANIEFDLELPQHGSLALLDFSLAFHGENPAPVISFYRKAARKPIFVHFDSALPLAAKLSCIRNERRRINDRCSLPIDAKRHQEDFNNILKLNGYPENILRPSAKCARRARKKHPIDKKWTYFQFPFINDKVQKKVQSIFTRNDLPVRVFDRNLTLRNALRRQQRDNVCNIKSCTMADSNLCHIKKCVYQLRCTNCFQCYIGSTLRRLHERVREHLQQDRSSVFQHKRICGAAFEVRVITRARDNTSLRFKEALLIRERRPAINAKREIDELLSLTF